MQGKNPSNEITQALHICHLPPLRSDSSTNRANSTICRTCLLEPCEIPWGRLVPEGQLHLHPAKVITDYHFRGASQEAPSATSSCRTCLPACPRRTAIFLSYQNTRGSVLPMRKPAEWSPVREAPTGYIYTPSDVIIVSVGMARFFTFKPVHLFMRIKGSRDTL
jgi:hypothetical protein